MTYETKFVGPGAALGAALALCDALCMPDGAHPRGTVCSVYFDTARLDSLWEKLDGDNLKAKCRARWYETPGVPGSDLCEVFLETKRKRGPTRDKTRRSISVDARQWRETPLDSPLFAQLGAEHFAEAAGPYTTAILEVRYERARYVEISSGLRVSVDWNIRCARANSRLFPRPSPPPLRCVVVELKGEAQELPAVLQPLLSQGFRRGALSKYGALVEKLLDGGAV